MGRKTLTENNLVVDLGDDRRPDVICITPEGDTKHLDIAVCHPHAGSKITNILTKPGALAEHWEKNKINKYPELDLIPIVFEHRGRPGMFVKTYLQLITKHIPDDRRSTTIADLWQTLSCTLQRETYHILQSAGTLLTANTRTTQHL